MTAGARTLADAGAAIATGVILLIAVALPLYARSMRSARILC